MKTSPITPAKILLLTLLLFTALLRHTQAAPGDVDLSFDPGSGVNGTVNTVLVQPDGKVIISGSFTSVNGTNRSKIAQLNAEERAGG